MYSHDYNDKIRQKLEKASANYQKRQVITQNSDSNDHVAIRTRGQKFKLQNILKIIKLKKKI